MYTIIWKSLMEMLFLSCMLYFVTRVNLLIDYQRDGDKL